MTFHQLKAWRERHSLTQSQAAKMLGISVDDLANYERESSHEGKSSIIPVAIQQACDHFNQKRERISALRSKIKTKINSEGPPGRITPDVLQEILLEILNEVE